MQDSCGGYGLGVIMVVLGWWLDMDMDKVSSRLDSVVYTFGDQKYIAFFWYSTSQWDFETVYKF